MLKDVEDELQRKVKSTRSRQGEQRDPEVELEVSWISPVCFMFKMYHVIYILVQI